VTGKTDLYVRIYRDSDGFYLDWDDDTFQSSGWTTLNKLLSEVDATNFPGLYEVTGGWDTSAIVNATADDNYLVLPLQTPGTDVVIPGPVEIKSGQWVDTLDVDVSTRAAPGDEMDLITGAVDASAIATSGAQEIRDEILSDATKFAGASRLPSDPADESLQQASHAQTQADIAALQDLSQADVQAAMTAQGYTSARAPNLDNLDATVSSRSDFDETADPVELLDTGGAAGTSAAELVTDIEADLASNHGSGNWDATATVPAQTIRDAMKLAPTAGAPAAGSVDAHLDSIEADTDSLDTTKITTARANNLDEITAARLVELDAANLPADVDAVLADTSAIDARLPSDPADNSDLLAQHTQTQADIATVGADAAKIDSAATATPGTATTGSLLDRLANKDGSKTYDQDTDSLEALARFLGNA
jgi:hypothetical protein